MNYKPLGMVRVQKNSQHTCVIVDAMLVTHHHTCISINHIICVIVSHGIIIHAWYHKQTKMYVVFIYLILFDNSLFLFFEIDNDRV